LNGNLVIGYKKDKVREYIESKDITIYGNTYMDNFDMDWFLTNHVKIDPEKVKWLD
jgi:hypothetical protein